MAGVGACRADGEEGERRFGGTSILPVIPLFPIVAWGIGVGLNLIHPKAGLYVVGGLHAVLFAAFVGSVICSAIKIKMRKPRTSA